MARIKKQAPDPHVLIPDTSVLWHEDKQFVVEPQFEAFYTKYSQEFALELMIPEVVRGELLFQQTTSALKGVKRINDAVIDVSKVTGKKYSHRIGDARVKREVEKRFDAWAATISASILDTPIGAILWDDIIHKSIWRLPPFSPDTKDHDNEKGFRDTLILETIKYYCGQESRQLPIAFICGDQLLRESAAKALGTDKRFTAYEKFEDFKTYLDLTRKKLEDVFIKAIIQRASEKFYSQGDGQCLFFRDNIKSTLQEIYKQHFDNPEGSNTLIPSYFSSVGLRRWEARDGGTFWIGNAQYVDTDADGHYIWQNLVRFVRQFARTEPVTLLSDKGKTDRRLQILPFVITWKAHVTSDGRFKEYSFIKDEMKEHAFRPISDEDKKNWNIE